MTAVWILLALLALGLPIAFALGLLGLGMLVVDGFSPLMVPQALLSTVDSLILLAVPLFLPMGNILLRGGVGRDLFDAVQAWVGHWPGGLAVATVVSCALFSAISGSSVATAATIGTVGIPEMIARGYERRFVLGLLAAGGTLGILIPPSIPMIVYGVVTEESIVSLFLAGILPGLLLAGLFVLYAMLHAAFGGGYTPSPKADAARRPQSLRDSGGRKDQRRRGGLRRVAVHRDHAVYRLPAMARSRPRPLDPLRPVRYPCPLPTVCVHCSSVRACSSCPAASTRSLRN